MKIKSIITIILFTASALCGARAETRIEQMRNIKAKIRADQAALANYDAVQTNGALATIAIAAGSRKPGDLKAATEWAVLKATVSESDLKSEINSLNKQFKGIVEGLRIGGTYSPYGRVGPCKPRISKPCKPTVQKPTCPKPCIMRH